MMSCCLILGDKEPLSTGTIVGIVFAVMAAVMAAIIIILVVFKRREYQADGLCELACTYWDINTYIACMLARKLLTAT